MLPTWIGVLLVLGACLAPLLLGALRWTPTCRRSTAHRTTNTVVLAGFPVGWAALAVTAASR